MGETVMITYGFIFARGGSKGVPGKNIRPLGGIPLIGHAVRAAKASGRIDRIIVSTDDQTIADVAEEYGAEAPFLRPTELAQDDSAEWAAWRHAIQLLAPFDVFVSIPCTSPLRTGDDIRSCIDLYAAGDCDMVVTVRKAERHPSFNMVTLNNEGYAALAMPLEETISHRQDAPTIFDMTTVAYVGSPDFIMNNGSMFDGKVKTVTIPAKRAVDIDTELDFAFAEFLMERTK